VDVRAQVVGLKDPPAPESLHEMVPVGEVGVVAESVTVAVSITVLALTAAEVPEPGDIDVVVGWGWLTVRDDVPELVACVKSPE
jgi:hypothetical protein